MMETGNQGVPDDTTSLGVSLGEGMIHYALVTSDSAGRTVIESRVFDIDPADGLDQIGRVNAGIDLMLDAARAADHRVGRIGVAARTATQRRKLRSGGSGTRRQVHLCSDEEAVAVMLASTGQIDRFSSVLVADIGDTGMSLYLVDPASGSHSRFQRSSVLSGRRIDEALADHVVASSPSTGAQTRHGRAALVSACRTAKEEAGSTGGTGTLDLNNDEIEKSIRPHLDDARAELSRYVATVAAGSSKNPEALVLVGGLANLGVVVDGIAADTELEVIVPPTPELAAATGAAMLVQGKTNAGRLAFIGGQRARKWFAAPAAMAVACVGAVVMAAVALGATLGDAGAPEPSTATSAPQDRPSEVRDSEFTTTASRTSVTSASNTAQVPAIPERQDYPGWATTELAQPTTWTSTLTLAPNTPAPTTTTPPSSGGSSSPSVSPGPTTTWSPPITIPPGIIPPGFLPSTLRPSPAPGTVTTGGGAHGRPSVASPSVRQPSKTPAPAPITSTTPAR